MIPVLYDADATSFVTNGYGRLSDAISCTVSEALNGAYTLTMVYPKDGIHASDIDYKRIIKAKPNDDPTVQNFRIVKITDSSDGRKMTINAQHISYDLNGYPMGVINVTGINNVISAFTNNCLVQHDFTFYTDLLNTTSNFKSEFPKSIRACIGGMEGSVIQLFKCELEFDNKNVRFLSHRGADNGASIRYGKNLESFVNIRSSESSYNGVLAYWYKPEENQLVTGTIQYADGASSFPTDRIYILDKSADYETAPSSSDLNTDATNYITRNNIGQAYLDSATVKFIPLWQTEEFKDIVGLEHVSMGDTVHVFYAGYNFSTRMIEYTFDVLNERYVNITLGARKSSFADTIKQIAEDTTNEILKN